MCVDMSSAISSGSLTCGFLEGNEGVALGRGKFGPISVGEDVVSLHRHAGTEILGELTRWVFALIAWTVATTGASGR